MKLSCFCPTAWRPPDGRALLSGGHIADGLGLRATQIYDYRTNTWAYQQAWNMNAGRWYPTTITLANGDILTMAGTNEQGQMNRIPQVWSASTNTWRNLTNLQNCGPCGSFYPWLHQAPNGKVFITGPQQNTGYIDVAGNGTYTAIGNTNKGYRGDHEGTSVMFAPGRILLLGGMPATNSAETINLNDAAPKWTKLPNMLSPRRKPQATILADGTVMVASGNAASSDFDPSSAFLAELYNPTSNTWTALDHTRMPRLYHSTSLLLNDGRVFNGGGGLGGNTTPHLNFQIYSPPYLFKGDRPSYSGAPATIDYNKQITLTTAQAAKIAKVHLIRHGAATHAFDAGQRIVPLNFTKGTNTLVVTTPASGNLAPPGPYMLFIVDNEGIPSIASSLLLAMTAPVNK